MKRTGPAWILLLTLLVSMLAFPAAAGAQAPFGFQEVVAEANGTQSVLAQGAAIDSKVTTLMVLFNHPLQTDSPWKYLTLKDSSGAWAKYSAEATENMLILHIPEPLKVGETYTLKVIGGPNGLKDQEGNSLPADVLFQFRTTGTPVERTLTIGAMDEVINPLQTNAYRLSAKAGPLKLKAFPIPDGLYHVLIRTPNPVAGETEPRTLYNGFMNADLQEATVQVPADGTYLLFLTRFTADGKQGHGGNFSLTGLELSGGNMYVPPVLLKEIAPGQVMSEPFDAGASILHNAPAKSLALLLDFEALSQNLLNADGSAKPYRINPAELSEGLHLLQAVAQSTLAPHLGIATRYFVVDQVDSFTDLPRSHWARTPIEVLADEAILNGRAAGRFEPEQPVTREEFAKMLALTIGLDLKEPSPGPSAFADLPADAWSRPYVEALAAEGLIKGETIDGKLYFNPKRTISRAEAATIIGRSMGISTAAVTPGESTFQDFAQVPDWAKPSVILLSRMKWISGFPDNTYQPAGTLTRAQAAKILVKYLGM